MALLLFLNLLIKPFWIFGIDRSVQNMIGAGEYGIYLALFNFSFILNILLDLGITNFNNRNIAQHPERLSLHFSNIVILRFVLAIVYAIVCILVGIISGYDKKQLLIIVFLIINQFLLSFILYLRSNLSGLHLFRLDSFVSVADRLLLIIICSVLLWGNVLSKPITVELFVYAQTATYFMVALGVFFIVFSKVKVFKLKFDFRFFVSVLKESYPFALLALLTLF